MADESSQDFDIDRTEGLPPRRTDKRGVLRMIHDELGKALGIGRAKDATVRGEDGSKQGVMDAVNEAVKGAPAPGSEY